VCGYGQLALVGTAETSLSPAAVVAVCRGLKPKQRGRLVMRWLKEGKDGLFRPSSDTWEEVPGALVGVRTQWVAGARGKTGGYRLLTLRSRILDTELVE